MRQFSKCLVVAVLAFSLGLHWALLQTVAWTGMALHYAKTDSLTVALAKTFDGKHPCQLCKIVRDGKNSEQQQEVQKPQVKLEFSLVSTVAFVHPPVPNTDAAAPADLQVVRIETPPTPPPRALHG